MKLLSAQELRPALTWFLVTASITCGSDLLTKAWVESMFEGRQGGVRSVIGGWLELSLTYNHGTAFSIVSDVGQARWVFGLLAAGLFFLLLRLVVTSPMRRWQLFGLGAVAGGGLGNGIERISGSGVVDFIKVNYPWGGNWPLFNAADVFVVVGVGILFLFSRGNGGAGLGSGVGAQGLS